LLLDHEAAADPPADDHACDCPACRPGFWESVLSWTPTEWLLYPPLGVALFAALTAWNACVVMLIWNWFAPEIFGLPRLTVWSALAVSWVAYAIQPDSPADRRDADGLVDGFAWPAFRLALAWLLHLAFVSGRVEF
jgi:hypothetical protein